MSGEDYVAIVGGLGFVWAGLDVMAKAVGSGRYASALESICEQVWCLAKMARDEWEQEGGATGHAGK